MIESAARMLHQLCLFLNAFWTGSTSVSLPAYLRIRSHLLAFMGLGPLIEDEDMDEEWDSATAILITLLNVSQLKSSPSKVSFE